jgi:hypothetical protein
VEKTKPATESAEEQIELKPGQFMLGKRLLSINDDNAIRAALGEQIARQLKFKPAVKILQMLTHQTVELRLALLKMGFMIQRGTEQKQIGVTMSTMQTLHIHLLTVSSLGGLTMAYQAPVEILTPDSAPGAPANEPPAQAPA